MRVKRGVASHAKHKKLLQSVKGYRMTKRRLPRVARQAYLHAGEYAFVGRKLKKRDFRRLWILRISEAVKERGLSYSSFIHKLKQANIVLDRKMLSDLVTEDPNAFEAVLDQAKSVH
ncbi:50S ribosomal protein L20 [Candidatus Gottesmanbacteria bacterium]|nr:50S ribosomal protein L20 [Candidatus Gottesmanbacteria bacterium]